MNGETNNSLLKELVAEVRLLREDLREHLRPAPTRASAPSARPTSSSRARDDDRPICIIDRKDPLGLRYIKPVVLPVGVVLPPAPVPVKLALPKVDPIANWADPEEQKEEEGKKEEEKEQQEVHDVE